MPLCRRNKIINEVKVQMSQREMGMKTEGRRRHRRTSSGDHMWLLSCPPLGLAGMKPEEAGDGTRPGGGSQARLARRKACFGSLCFILLQLPPLKVDGGEAHGGCLLVPFLLLSAEADHGKLSVLSSECGPRWLALGCHH